MNDLPYGARVGMVPCALHLRVQAADGTGITREILFDPMARSFADEALDALFIFDGEIAEVAVVPKSAVRIEACSLVLRHAFATEERVLLNGYQSWTDTVERLAWARMRGLRGLHPVLVNRYALDGGGDYRFHEYTGKAGRQHGYTYATFRRGEGMVLVGSLDEDRGFTKISIRASLGHVILEPECPCNALAAGERTVLGRFAITRGEQDACYDRYFELAGISARPAPALVGYGSWYRHYGNIDEAKLAADLAGAIDVLPPLLSESLEKLSKGSRTRMGGGDSADAVVEDGAQQRKTQLLFQIDDGYCKVGDWLDVDTAKFPHGLAPLARAAGNAGFLPGLWVAPFVCERDSRLFSEHGDWLLRDEAGAPVTTGCHWSGGYALDTRNPEVRTYVLETLQTMVEEWGFGLLKADFLYAACLLPHDGLNRGQLMADALDLLRTGAGDACLILGCGVPLGSAFGRLDYCRIGCDVGLNWDGYPQSRMMHRERVSTKNSLANTYGRAPLDGRAFGNDPDVFFLRDDVRLTPDQRDELLFADADLGSVFLTSDDMGAWSEQAMQRYRIALGVFLERMI